jgi:hypothetical protein
MLEIKDESLLLNLDFSGRGGKEKQIMQLFPSFSRKDTKKLDFICLKETIIYETKKQQDQQWFNLAKFYNLTKNEQRINLLFICFNQKDGLVDLIFCIEKGEFLNLLINNKKMKDRGWSMGVIEKAYELVNLAPIIQPKISVGMRKFYKDYNKEVKTIYNKKDT